MRGLANLPLHQSIHHHHQNPPPPLNSPAHQRDLKLIKIHNTHAPPHRVTYMYPQYLLLPLGHQALIKLLTMQPRVIRISLEVTSTPLGLILLHLSPSLLLWECFHLPLPLGVLLILPHPLHPGQVWPINKYLHPLLSQLLKIDETVPIRHK